jgi:hypothetical protein
MSNASLLASALLVVSPSTACGQRGADAIAFPQLNAIDAVEFVLSLVGLVVALRGLVPLVRWVF